MSTITTDASSQHIARALSALHLARAALDAVCAEPDAGYLDQIVPASVALDRLVPLIAELEEDRPPTDVDALARELLAAWEEHGPSGWAHPADEEAAIEQAIADRDVCRMHEQLACLVLPKTPRAVSPELDVVR